MSPFLLTVSERAGKPLVAVNGTEVADYVGYFVGASGEQLIFRYDAQEGRGTLTRSATGWIDDVTVSSGRAITRRASDRNPVYVELTRPEEIWLAACWEAASGETVRWLEFNLTVGLGAPNHQKVTPE